MTLKAYRRNGSHSLEARLQLRLLMLPPIPPQQQPLLFLPFVFMAMPPPLAHIPALPLLPPPQQLIAIAGAAPIRMSAAVRTTSVFTASSINSKNTIARDTAPIP